MFELNIADIRYIHSVKAHRITHVQVLFNCGCFMEFDTINPSRRNRGELSEPCVDFCADADFVYDEDEEERLRRFRFSHSNMYFRYRYNEPV